MSKTISIMLVIVAAIHLIPVTGAISPERLSVLYGLSFEETNLSILMRHRAILFGLCGVFFLYASFRLVFHPLALIAGFVSVLSFIGISLTVGDYNEAITRVIIADLVALICLIIALICYIINKQKN